MTQKQQITLLDILETVYATDSKREALVRKWDYVLEYTSNIVTELPESEYSSVAKMLEVVEAATMDTSSEERKRCVCMTREKREIVL
jgi:hypothetical protein